MSAPCRPREGREWVGCVACAAAAAAAVCGMGLLNLDQETAFGSVEASSVLSAAAAAGAQEEKPRVRSPGNAAQDQVGRRWGGP